MLDLLVVIVVLVVTPVLSSAAVVYACWSVSRTRRGVRRWLWRLGSLPLAALVGLTVLLGSAAALEHEASRPTRQDYLTCQRVPGGC